MPPHHQQTHPEHRHNTHSVGHHIETCFEVVYLLVTLMNVGIINIAHFVHTYSIPSMSQSALKHKPPPATEDPPAS